MASETATPIDVQSRTRIGAWQAGLAGGLAGGVVFGVLMTMMMQPVIEMAIPGLYGLEPSLLTGWGIHLVNSIIFGLVFVGALRLTGFENRFSGPTAITAAGLTYGIVLWLVLASIVMPAWVGAMTEMAPPVPDWSAQSLVGHAVYGLVLGLLYTVMSR